MPEDTEATTSFEDLFTNYPDLKVKLEEAITTGRFFITISCDAPVQGGDPNNLRHFWKSQGYPQGDVPNTLDHIKRDFLSKNFPQAVPEGEGKGGEWH